MYLLKKIGLVIKRHSPRLYTQLRSLFSPLYFRAKAHKTAAFTTRTVTEVTHEGYTFLLVVDPANGFVDTEVFSAGVYEPDILSVIKSHLPAAGTYVDIGANIGHHALFAARHLSPAGHVIACEPIPRLVAQINESIALNAQENISVHQIACSSKETTFTLSLNPDNIGGSGFHHTKAGQETIIVHTVTADSLLKDEPRVDFIKIDTEGHELAVLEGLAETLTAHSPTLLIEYSPSFWGDSRTEMNDAFFSILNHHHYVCYDLEAGHTRIENPLQWAASFTKAQTNLLCIPKKS